MPARDGPRAPHRRDQRGQPPLRGRRQRAARHPAARLSGVLVLVAAPDRGPRAPFPRRRARSPRLRSERQAPERRGVRAPRAGRRRARAGRGVRRAPGGDRRPRLGRRRRLELRHGAPGGHAAPRGDELPAPGDLRAASQDRPPPARTQLVHVLLPDPVAPGGAPRPRPRAPDRRRHPPYGGAPGLAQRGGPPAPPRGGLPTRRAARRDQLLPRRLPQPRGARAVAAVAASVPGRRPADRGPARAARGLAQDHRADAAGLGRAGRRARQGAVGRHGAAHGRALRGEVHPALGPLGAAGAAPGRERLPARLPGRPGAGAHAGGAVADQGRVEIQAATSRRRRTAGTSAPSAITASSAKTREVPIRSTSAPASARPVAPPRPKAIPPYRAWPPVRFSAGTSRERRRMLARWNAENVIACPVCSATTAASERAAAVSAQRTAVSTSTTTISCDGATRSTRRAPQKKRAISAMTARPQVRPGTVSGKPRLVVWTA